MRKSVRDSKKQVRRFNVEFFMASVDDLETNKAFADQNNANFPILSDSSKTVSEAYRVLAGMAIPNAGRSILMLRAGF